MLRENDEWLVDKKGSKILNGAYPKIQQIYDVQDMNDVNKTIKNMNHLLEFENKGKKKIINQLNKKTLLKNNVK